MKRRYIRGRHRALLLAFLPPRGAITRSGNVVQTPYVRRIFVRNFTKFIRYALIISGLADSSQCLGVYRK